LPSLLIRMWCILSNPVNSPLVNWHP